MQNTHAHHPHRECSFVKIKVITFILAVCLCFSRQKCTGCWTSKASPAKGVARLLLHKQESASKKDGYTLESTFQLTPCPHNSHSLPFCGGVTPFSRFASTLRWGVVYPASVNHTIMVRGQSMFGHIKTNQPTRSP